MKEVAKEFAKESNKPNEGISFKSLAVLFMHNLIYTNDETVVLGFDGFTVLIEKAKDDRKECICNATIMYLEAGRMEKEVYCMKTIIQLIRWLKCINKHNKMMFLLGFCENVEQIPNALKNEPMYLISKLDQIVNK